MNKLYRSIYGLLVVALLVTSVSTSVEAQRRRTRRRTARTTASQLQSQLTGTYRLDASRSDDARSAVDRATRDLPDTDSQSVSGDLMARLDAPEMLAIERRGRSVTVASSRAPRITFTADGIQRTELLPDGHTARVSATLNGDQLVVSTTGDRDSDFSVTFAPLDNGRRLSVTRRIYNERLSQPVVIQSVYDKTAEVAQWSVYGGSTTVVASTNQPVETNSNRFIIPNGTTLVTTLNDNLSTKQAGDRDRFTLTVQQPSQYEGATIEGYISNVRRSGKITGRSEMTLNFDRIRLRDGRSYRFAGLVENVRASNGENVRIDNEGTVREGESRTTTTEKRAGIGGAVGAIIGAIASGGKGAAIGAIVGAGAGAGSVYVEGRDDLELRRGTEVRVRSTSPR